MNIHNKPWRCPAPFCSYHFDGYTLKQYRDKHFFAEHVSSSSWHCSIPDCAFQTNRFQDVLSHLGEVHVLTNLEAGNEMLLEGYGIDERSTKPSTHSDSAFPYATSGTFQCPIETCNHAYSRTRRATMEKHIKEWHLWTDDQIAEIREEYIQQSINHLAAKTKCLVNTCPKTFSFKENVRQHLKVQHSWTDAQLNNNWHRLATVGLDHAKKVVAEQRRKEK